MFTKGNKDDDPRHAPLPKTPAPPSILSTDLKIVGDMVSHGEIQIDGVVEGDIHSDILVVGESAQVFGEIVADSCRVHGHVTGQIRARSVSLAKTSHVLGDILHESLAIEQGAFLEGHCRRIEAGAASKKDKDADGGISLLKGSKTKTEQPQQQPAVKKPEPAEAPAAE